jgi:hypothetical protein
MSLDEALAKLALRAKFDDFDVGSIFCKLTYPIGHRRFAKNSNPTLKAQIWPQMEFCKSLISSMIFGLFPNTGLVDSFSGIGITMLLMLEIPD